MPSSLHTPLPAPAGSSSQPFSSLAERARAFVPARLLKSRHAQTIWGGLLRRRAKLPLEHACWMLDDGHRLSIHVLPERPHRPGVLVLHGLEGSARARYVGGLLARVHAAGWNGAALDFRSCGETAAGAPVTMAPKDALYHAGRTDDLASAVARLRQRWGDVPLGAVGFSLGGNMLVKWLGELGAQNPLRAAVAVSVPFDLAACAAAIDARGFWSYLYRERFLRSLRAKARRHAVAFPDVLDAPAIDACRSFATYDHRVVARVFGFADAADYWTRCSARRFLADVQRPTLLVAGADDPFVPPHAVPTDTIAGNAHLTLALCPGGGHVGFVAGSPWKPRYVAEDLAIEFLNQHLQSAAR